MRPTSTTTRCGTLAEHGAGMCNRLTARQLLTLYSGVLDVIRRLMRGLIPLLPFPPLLLQRTHQHTPAITVTSAANDYQLECFIEVSSTTPVPSFPSSSRRLVIALVFFQRSKVIRIHEGCLFLQGLQAVFTLHKDPTALTLIRNADSLWSNVAGAQGFHGAFS